MKFLFKVLILVSLIVIQKFTKEEPIKISDQLTSPAGFPVYSQETDPVSFPDRIQIVQPKTTSGFVRFN
ncbi:hypothetical protein BH24BAC1_BH24BAC1_22570 [soil metagenome]